MVWFHILFKPSNFVKINPMCVLCHNCEYDRDKFHLTKTHLCYILNTHIDPADEPKCNNKFEMINFLERLILVIWGR